MKEEIRQSILADLKHMQENPEPVRRKPEPVVRADDMDEVDDDGLQDLREILDKVNKDAKGGIYLDIEDEHHLGPIPPEIAPEPAEAA
jgi:hypothetical protein